MVWVVEGSFLFYQGFHKFSIFIFGVRLSYMSTCQWLWSNIIFLIFKLQRTFFIYCIITFHELMFLFLGLWSRLCSGIFHRNDAFLGNIWWNKEIRSEMGFLDVFFTRDGIRTTSEEVGKRFCWSGNAFICGRYQTHPYGVLGDFPL